MLCPSLGDIGMGHRQSGKKLFFIPNCCSGISVFFVEWLIIKMQHLGKNGKRRKVYEWK
jgi:hypothetical protein